MCSEIKENDSTIPYKGERKPNNGYHLFTTGILPTGGRIELFITTKKGFQSESVPVREEYTTKT